MPSPLREEARQSATLIAAQVATGLLTLAYTAIVGRALGPERAADFFAALFLVFALATVASPVNGAITRFASVRLARGEGAVVRSTAARVARRLAAAGLVVVLAGVVLAGPIAEALELTASAVAAIAVTAGALAIIVNVPRGILRGASAFSPLASNLVLEAVLRVGFGGGLLLIAADAASALLAYPLALAAVAAAGWVQVARAGRSWDPGVDSGPAESEVWSLVGPLLVFAVASAGFANADVLLVQRYFAESGETGPYGAVATLARLFGALVIPFQVLLLPILTLRHTTGEGVVAPFLRITGLFVALCLPALFGFTMVAEGLVGGLFGEEFSRGAPLLLPLSLTVIVGALAALVGQAFISIRRFSFLVPYLGGFLLELVAVGARHESPMEIVMTVLWVKLATLAVIGFQLWLALRDGRSTGVRAE